MKQVIKQSYDPPEVFSSIREAAKDAGVSPYWMGKKLNEGPFYRNGSMYIFRFRKK